MNNKNFALVTGACSGIGLAMSRELAGRGYPVLLVSNDEENILLAAKKISAEYGVKTIGLYLDLARADSAQKLFDYCMSNNITVEILINNAGMFFFGDITETPPGRMEAIINLHTFVPALLCRYFAEQMVRENRHGYILNISSISAWMMMPGLALYAATKSFLRCFSRAMNRETADRGVSITTVCPGAIATGLYKLPEHYLKLGVRLGIIMKPERFARLAVKKMFKRKSEYIPGGFINRLFVFLVLSMPEALIRYIRKKVVKTIGQSLLQ